MRKKRQGSGQNNFSILTVDDDPIMTSTLQAYFQRSGYYVDVENDPCAAIERVRKRHYDILLLDFLMTPISGDQVVEEIRNFDKDIFIILLTGHKSVAPPIKTIRELDIQGYYEKDERFDQLELLVESCAKSIIQMRTIQNYKNGLSAIMDSLPEIYHLQSFEHIMGVILKTASTLIQASGYVLELSPDFGQGEEETYQDNLIKIQGETEGYPRMIKMSVWNGEKGTAIVYDEPWVMLPFHNSSGKIIGLLSARVSEVPKDDKFQLLEVFSKQVSVALSNVLLHSLVERKNNEIMKAYAHLRSSYVEVVDALRILVDARDTYTRGHSDRVAECASMIAKAMGKDDSYCERVRIAGLFHDIGKIGVSDEILMKKGPLTEEEFAIIKKHPQDGARILSALTMFRDIVPIVRSHHERMDGKGYPDGLKSEMIPEEARIIAVADSFDAMTSNRSYRKALSIKAAVDELVKGKNTQFDPAAVEAFLSIDSEYLKESGE